MGCGLSAGGSSPLSKDVCDCPNAIRRICGLHSPGAGGDDCHDSRSALTAKNTESDPYDRATDIGNLCGCCRLRWNSLPPPSRTSDEVQTTCKTLPSSLSRRACVHAA